MGTRKKNKRSSSGSSRNSDHSRDDSRRREELRRKDERTGRQRDRDFNRDASRDRSKGSAKFEDRFADVQRKSRVDYSSDERSPTGKSKQKENKRSNDREERGDSPRRADSRIHTRSRSGKSRSRSRDRLDYYDDDSARDEPQARSRKTRQSKHDEPSDLSDDDQRDRNGAKKSKHGKGAASRENKPTRYDSDASYQDTSRPKSRNEAAARSNRHGDDFEQVDLTPSSRKKEQRGAGKLNQGFENSEAGLRPTRYDSDLSDRGPSTSRTRLNDPIRDGSEVRKTDRWTEHREEVELTDSSQKDAGPTGRNKNRAFKDPEVKLRPADDTRPPRDQSKRNGIVHPTEPPEELTFRARELNNVPDPRSTLCQRTDMMLGVMDTRRDLAETDAFAFESPKGRRISTYIAAAISVVEALLGLAVGIFLLVDAEKQNIKDYKTYMVYTYMILHGLALVFGVLLIWANKQCQLDLMVAWIAVQISTGIVFVAGTILFLVVEMLPGGDDLKNLVLGAPFIYFSSAFLIFIVLKVLTVAIVILRYQRLTFMPKTRGPKDDRPVSRWAEYQPPPNGIGRVPSEETVPKPEDAERESDAPAASNPPGVSRPEGHSPSRVPPPLPERTVSVNDEHASTLRSKIEPVSEVPPPLDQTGRSGSKQSISSVSTANSELPSALIPRATTSGVLGASLKPPIQGGRTPSPRPDSSPTRPPTRFSYVADEQHVPRDDLSGSRFESPNTRREPPYARQEPSYPRQEPLHSRQELSYQEIDRYYREPEIPHSTREPSFARDRSPHVRPESSYARPIPAARPSLASRSRPDRLYRDDPEPARGAPSRRYLPPGAVPAIGSPEEWERNHHQYSYGMPQTHLNAALHGAARRHHRDCEPEPDY